MSPKNILKDVPLPLWLMLMVVAFVWFWPVGIMLLGVLLGNGLLGNAGGAPWSRSFWSSGNSAFDKYQAEQRAVLDKERTDFAAFLAEKLTAEEQAEFKEFKQRPKPN